MGIISFYGYGYKGMVDCPTEFVERCHGNIGHKMESVRNTEAYILLYFSKEWIANSINRKDAIPALHKAMNDKSMRVSQKNHHKNVET